MKSQLLACAGLTLLCAAPVKAATIDMEGIAPSGVHTHESNTTRTFGDFNVALIHGHYVPDNSPDVLGGVWADNGTDWLLHDTDTAMTVGRNDGSSFSIQSFDATEWFAGTAGGNMINVSGFFSVGGAIFQTFVTDAPDAFETFVFTSLWTGLSEVRFSNSTGHMAYDNIVANQSVAAVPLPAAFPLFVAGLGLLSLLGWRRRRGISS